MDIESLRCFVAVVETGSYSQAAKQVHRSQSAVSQKMHKLADQTGKLLFLKVGRTHELTEDGKFLLGYARHIVSIHDDVMRQMRDSKTIIRPLRLGCPDDYVDQILPKVLQQIQQVVPDMPVTISCHNSLRLRQLLAQSELDIVVLSRGSAKEAGHFLEESQGIWAFNGNCRALQQAYKSKSSVALVLFDESCHFHHAAVQGLSQINIASQIKCSTNSVSAIKSLVSAGQGITVVAKCSANGLIHLTKDNNPLPFELPNLPSVIIEMVIAANAHPNFGRAQLKEVCERYVG